MSEIFVLSETRGRVGLLTLNRPKALNALNDQLMDQLGAGLLAFEANDDIGCIVITGSEKAKFGQPEIKLGVIPGSGGTQRLPRAVGKAKAMEMVLTGRMMDAVEAERAGLVSRIVAADRLLDDAIETATVIAGMSLPATMMAKESVNRAYESSLTEGVLFERRVFHSCFAMEDQKEGMAAFVEKRKAVFKHR